MLLASDLKSSVGEIIRLFDYLIFQPFSEGIFTYRWSKMVKCDASYVPGQATVGSHRTNGTSLTLPRLPIIGF